MLTASSETILPVGRKCVGMSRAALCPNTPPLFRGLGTWILMVEMRNDYRATMSSFSPPSLRLLLPPPPPPPNAPA